jgi:hypothetical protein
VLKLGLLIGGIIGAVVATLLQAPKDDSVMAVDTDAEPKNVVDKVKLQVKEAQLAAQAERKAKEAEVMAEYEAARQRDRSD